MNLGVSAIYSGKTSTNTSMKKVSFKRNQDNKDDDPRIKVLQESIARRDKEITYLKEEITELKFDAHSLRVGWQTLTEQVREKDAEIALLKARITELGAEKQGFSEVLT